MIGYYLRLALHSFRRNVGLTSVMVIAVGLGIAVCVVMLTIYHAMSGNPIWWKAERLYAVTMDLGYADKPFNVKHPELPPPQLAYRDAKYLAAHAPARRHSLSFWSVAVIVADGAHAAPTPISTRETTGDFFAMFDVPFQYGTGWSSREDQGPAPVIVLSKSMNDKLFGGENSVGRTVRWNDHPFRVVGVLKDWLPMPKFFDLVSGAFNAPEAGYIPFAWGVTLKQVPNAGSVDCTSRNPVNSYDDFLNADCMWLQLWVELPDAASRTQMQTLMDNYWSEQRKAGRFPRARNNRLTNVDQWLRDNDVVRDDNRVLIGLAMAFLAICLFNTIGVLLAKFLGRASITGIRRALGATRRDITVQYLLEAGVLAVAGATFGLVLAAFGLAAVRALYSQPDRGGFQELTHFDTTSVLWAVALAAVSALAAGCYPAWRMGRLPPARYLKA